MGTLYVVGTPIGNLEDITLRALRILKEVDVIAAEDTRHTRLLLDKYGIGTPLTSYHEHNERAKTQTLVDRLGRGERIGVGSGRNYPQIYEVMERLNGKYVHRPISASQNANLARPRQDAAHFLWANIPTVSIGTSGAARTCATSGSMPMPLSRTHSLQPPPAASAPIQMRGSCTSRVKP